MKLWVDDIRNAPDGTWHVARTVTAAIGAMQQFSFEEISLDHDISHQVNVDGMERPYPCAETFFPVALFIGLKYENHVYCAGASAKPPKVTIHSANPVGAERMERELQLFGVDPEMRPMGAANRLEMEL